MHNNSINCRLCNVTVGPINASNSHENNNIDPIVRDYSIDINAFDTPFLPIIGPTGIGKTTLLMTLSAQIYQQSGKIEWYFPFLNDTSQKSYSWSGGNIRKFYDITQPIKLKQFGTIPQKGQLLEFFDLEYNLILPQLLQGYRWYEAARNTINKWNQVFRKDEKMRKIRKRSVSKISGGQEKRMSILQTILRNPCVIFADEPTGNLDKISRFEVLNTLQKWVKSDERGKRMLIWTTHHLDEDIDSLNKMVGLETTISKCLCFGYKKENRKLTNPKLQNINSLLHEEIAKPS